MDGKTMVHAEKMVGRTVKPDQTTDNGTENSPVKAYYEFPQSNVKSHTTYENRMSKLEDALGNKDSVKG